MSFTIICDKCGTNQVFKDGVSMDQKHIDIEVTENFFNLPTGISIMCCGSDCKNVINLEY